MKTIYIQTIHEKMKDALIEAVVAGKRIDEFRLTQEEWLEFNRNPRVPNLMRSDLPEGSFIPGFVGTVTVSCEADPDSMVSIISGIFNIR